MDRFYPSLKQTASQPSRLKFLLGPGLWILLVAMTFVSLLLLAAMYRHDRTAEMWHEEIREMQYYVSLFYFTLKAQMTNDPLDRSPSPWENMQEARDSVQVLLTGGIDREDQRVEPFDNAELIEESKVLLTRLAYIEMIGRTIEKNAAFTGFTAEQDAAFDRAIHEILNQSNLVEMRIRGILSQNHALLNAFFISVVSGWTLGLGLALFGIRVYERERRKAEQTILQAKRDWERTFDSVPDLIAILDTDHGIRRVNRAMADRLGVKPADAVGRKCFEVVHCTGCAIDNCPHSALLSDRQPHAAEVFEERLGGHFLLTTSPVVDESGNLVGSIHVAHDITARKKAEDTLKERLKELACLYSIASILETPSLSLADILKKTIESIPAGWQFPQITEARISLMGMIFQTDRYQDTPWKLEEVISVRGRAEGRIEVCYLEEKPEDHTGPFFQEEVALIRGIARMLESASERWIAETELQKALAATEEKVRTRTTELQEANRTLQKEIEEHQRAEDSLKTSEARFRQLSGEFNALLNSIQDAILLLAPNLKVVWANREAALQLKRPASELVGRFCHEMVHESAEPCGECPVRRCYETGRPNSRQVITKSGRTLDLRADPVGGEDGRPANVILLIRDISETVQLHADAMRSAQLASLGELAAGVAHEINNPINGIINYAQIVANDTPAESEIHGMARRIIREGDRVAAIVGSLLSFARGGSDEIQTVHIAEVLDDAYNFLRSRMGKDGIRLTIDIPAGTPPVRASSQKLRQVFLNLLINSQHALNERYPGQRADKRIEVRAAPLDAEGGSYVRIVFRDNGTGIAPENLDRIFTPFFTTKAPGRGTGLGLSISHTIIKDHGGRITVDSRLGEYTDFMVDLPLWQT